MIQHHGEIPSICLAYSQPLQLGEQVKRLILVPLERTQTDAIEERTHLFLRAAFLDGKLDNVLLAWTHAVNGRAQFSTRNSAWGAI
jgi:hypothetical protein